DPAGPVRTNRRPARGPRYTAGLTTPCAKRWTGSLTSPGRVARSKTTSKSQSRNTWRSAATGRPPRHEAEEKIMSYVRCYRCGVACQEGSFVRMTVRTWSGMRRSNVCHDCAAVYHEQREKAKQVRIDRARIFLVLTAVGGAGLIAAVVGIIAWLTTR